jgi:hypothetical protein
MNPQERDAYVQRLMATLTGEGEPSIITESGEIVAGEALPSCEEVAYDLDLHPWVLDELASEIIQAVRRLPEDIREFVYEKCLFVQGWLRVVRTPIHKPYVIILPESFGPDDNDGSLIAHQIGLAWIQEREHTDCCTLADDIHAAELVQTWGFMGAGANVEQYRQEAERYGPATFIM